MEQLRKDVAQLKENIRELSGELERLSIVLKGSKAMDIIGVFERIKDSVTAAEKFQSDCNKKLDLIEQNLETKFDLLHKDVEVRYMEMHEFKVRIETYLNIVSSKIFWRVVIGITMAGLVLITWNKGGFELFARFLKHLMEVL